MKTMTLELDACTDLRARLEDAIQAGVLRGDLLPGGFRVYAGPALTISGRLEESMRSAMPHLDLTRPLGATGVTAYGMLEGEGATQTIRVRFTAPIFDQVLLVLIGVLMLPMAEHALTAPGLSPGTRAILIGGALSPIGALIGASGLRIQRLRRALRQILT